MLALRSPVFIIALLVLCLHQLLQKGLEINFELADSYLDNLLAMPILLTLLLVERRWLFKKGSSYSLSVLEIVVATSYIVVISEVLFPLLSNKFKADCVDVVFFAVGSFIFHLTINKPETKSKTME
jgi:hypothetical protein